MSRTYTPDDLLAMSDYSTGESYELPIAPRTARNRGNKMNGTEPGSSRSSASGLLIGLFGLVVGSLIASLAPLALDLARWGWGAVSLFYLAALAYAIAWVVRLVRHGMSRSENLMALVLGLAYWLVRLVWACLYP